jgi:hypothetical protein
MFVVNILAPFYYLYCASSYCAMNERHTKFALWWRERYPNGSGWLRKLFRVAARPHSESSLPTGLVNTDPTPVWAVVANVVEMRPYGPAGKEWRRGTKQLAPGGKVYVFGEYRNSNRSIVTVVGRHRVTKRYITIDMRVRHLTHWRVKLVRSPYVLRQIKNWGWFSQPAPSPEAERSLAEAYAQRFASDELSSQNEAM